MSDRVYFKNVNIAPRGGFFYEINGEAVSAPHFCLIEGPVKELMRKYHVQGTAEEAVANYMCPRIPEASWMCTGSFSRSVIRPAEALSNSFSIMDGKEVVPFDDIEKRLRVCMSCPKHTREFCVTCTGHMERILRYLSGRRPKLPEDNGTGICKCCKAYESAVASMEYRDGDAMWDGAPETCWRNQK